MDERVARQARERGGVVALRGPARRQRRELARSIGAADLRRTGRRTAVAATSPGSFGERLWIARLELGDPMAFTGPTGAAILRLARFGEEPLYAMVPRSRRPSAVPGLTLTHAAPGDLVGVRTVDGLPVTSVEVTVREIGRVLPVERLVTVVQDQLRLRTTTGSRLRSVLGRGRAGSARLRAALDLAGDGAHSQAERQLYTALVSAGTTGFRRQAPLAGRDGASWWLDVLFPGAGIGIEIMGPHHLEPEQFEYDCRRANRILADHGVRLLRYTSQQVSRDPAGVAADILRVIGQSPGRSGLSRDRPAGGDRPFLG